MGWEGLVGFMPEKPCPSPFLLGGCLHALASKSRMASLLRRGH